MKLIKWIVTSIYYKPLNYQNINCIRKIMINNKIKIVYLNINNKYAEIYIIIYTIIKIF